VGEEFVERLRQRPEMKGGADSTDAPALVHRRRDMREVRLPWRRAWRRRNLSGWTWTGDGRVGVQLDGCARIHGAGGDVEGREAIAKRLRIHPGGEVYEKPIAVQLFSVDIDRKTLKSLLLADVVASDSLASTSSASCVWVDYGYRLITMISTEKQIRRMTPVAAPPEQKAEVVALSKLLGGLAHAQPRRPRCELAGPKGERIAIPESVFYVLARVAEVLARGDAVTVVPTEKEITTQEAADLLNLSRQYVVRLLDEGRIPFTKAGKHRRIRIEDLLRFKAKRDEERKGTLDELAGLSEDVGGYEELK
jgi:excisionase family DNA binding protein